jgi:broad specificity phosphatase PhoE
MQRENVPDLKVWTSSMQRTIQTAALFENVTSFKALDELNAGQFEVTQLAPRLGIRLSEAYMWLFFVACVLELEVGARARVVRDVM